VRMASIGVVMVGDRSGADAGCAPPIRAWTEGDTSGLPSQMTSG
jgi:hypothetical protein